MEGITVDATAEVGAGDGAFWVDANAEAVDGIGAFCEPDRRSPIMALDLELDSDPIGSGEQPNNPADNATSASSLLKRESCDMASSTPSEPLCFVAKLMANRRHRTGSGPAGAPVHVGRYLAPSIQQKGGGRRTVPIVAGGRPRQLTRSFTG